MSAISIGALVIGGFMLNWAFLKQVPYLAIVAGVLYAYAIWKG